MPEKIIIANLRRVQSFDAGLKSTNRIDVIASDFAEAILFQRNARKRNKTIDQLVGELVNEARDNILPQGEKIGTQNAIDMLSKTPAAKGIDLADARERGAALLRGKLKAKQRVAIVKESVQANGSELNASLTRYWLEPSEGSDTRAKLKRLRDIHEAQEKKRKEWETDLRDFHNGERKSRPAAPKLDYMAEMTSQSKKDIRVQARRAGTDAETAAFVGRGHKYLVWIAPNGIVACPDCINRKNVVLTLEEWEAVGRPGSGRTVCDVHCFCMLIPKETVSVAPNLITARETKERGPLTDAATLAYLNRNRVENTTR